MGGRPVKLADQRRSPLQGEPLLRVQDAHGLWSFEFHGNAKADLAIVLLPGMGVPGRYYDSLVSQLLDEHVAVVRVDFLATRVERGLPGSPKGFAALVEQCFPAVLEALNQHLASARPVIVGHSLGGQLGLVAAARYAPDLQVVLAASGSAWYRAFSGWRRWQYLAGSHVIAMIARVLRYWPGDRLGFGGRQPDALIRDWARVVRSGRYRAAGGTFDYETALAAYRGELLVIDVDQDVLAPRTATDQLLAKVPDAHVSRFGYTASRGQASPGAHFTWVKDSPGPAAPIADWGRRQR